MKYEELHLQQQVRYQKLFLQKKHVMDTSFLLRPDKAVIPWVRFNKKYRLILYFQYFDELFPSMQNG